MQSPWSVVRYYLWDAGIQSWRVTPNLAETCCPGC
uniref:Uncharacterized protein n=1 Tax=Pelodiscus sinensis TaxID=13735 RepID=K7F0X1_PELSI